MSKFNIQLDNEITVQPQLPIGMHTVTLKSLDPIYQKDELGIAVTAEDGRKIIKGYNFVWTDKIGREIRDYRSLRPSAEALEKDKNAKGGIVYIITDLAQQLQKRLNIGTALNQNQVLEYLETNDVIIDITENTKNPDLPNCRYPSVSITKQ